jgi:hypothetical protein
LFGLQRITHWCVWFYCNASRIQYFRPKHFGRGNR